MMDPASSAIVMYQGLIVFIAIVSASSSAGAIIYAAITHRGAEP